MPAYDDVEREAERPFGPRQREIEARDQASARALVVNGLEDGVMVEQRVFREVHLGNEPRAETRSEE